MKLSIDTSQREKTILKIDNHVFESNWTMDKSHMLLPFIESSLHELSLTFSDISQISVATGPGSFTGLRVGVSVAQILGWSLEIPVNGEDFSRKKYLDIKY